MCNSVVGVLKAVGGCSGKCVHANVLSKGVVGVTQAPFFLLVSRHQQLPKCTILRIQDHVSAAIHNSLYPCITRRSWTMRRRANGPGIGDILLVQLI
jgi:hypothetical protein